MHKIGILTDTTSDLNLEVQNNENIKIIPLQVIFNDGRTFRDKYDISYKDCMSSLDSYDTKTSLPVISEAIRAFDEFLEEGYTHIIVMTISQNLSGTYNMVKTVSEEYKDKLVISNIDTKSVAYGIGHVVAQTAKMAKKGIDFETLNQYATDSFKNQQINFAVETLKYLQKGGRISRISGTIGEALDIKPIINMTEEGRLVPVDKVRGRKKSILKIEEITRNIAQKHDIDKIYIAHGDRMEDAQRLKDRIRDITEKEVDIVDLGTLVSVHAGPGVLGTICIWS
ncbi:DegV family protein [Proteocatella sphenisci]|uniref:DegV family protein n=1 Tax=Proteocatella sphenisci TaxID=181070 RepID=UPI0004B010CA|nr:DegV family protein [Proteocatella sphenisci]